MKLKEGPFFGAAVITVGVAYLVHQQTGNLAKALLIGGAVGAADYILLSLFGGKRK